MNTHRLLSFIKRKIRQKRSSLFWYEKDPFIPMDPKRRKNLLRNGFLPSDDLIYDFKNYPKELFVNERDYQKILPANGPMAQLIDYKFYLPLILQNRKDLLPDFFAYLSKKRIVFQRGENIPAYTAESLLERALGKFQKLILKPTSSSGGKGILIISEANIKNHLEKILNSEWVVNNFLENEVFFKAVFPGSLNTTRVVFFKNSTGKNQIFMIAQRFGNSISSGLDNVHAGGLACVVNIETGTLSKGYSFINEKYRGWFSNHMETLVQIEGVQIPSWDSKLTKIKNIVEKDLDFLEYGGIDLAFTPKGLKLIEINSKPDIQLIQSSGPALLNQEFQAFLFSKGYNPKFNNTPLSKLSYTS